MLYRRGWRRAFPRPTHLHAHTRVSGGGLFRLGPFDYLKHIRADYPELDEHSPYFKIQRHERLKAVNTCSERLGAGSCKRLSRYSEMLVKREWK